MSQCKCDNCLRTRGGGYMPCLNKIPKDPTPPPRDPSGRGSARSERAALVTALQKYEEAFDRLFGQCCSNGVYDTWGRPVDCTTINEAHSLAREALGEGCHHE